MLLNIQLIDFYVKLSLLQFVVELKCCGGVEDQTKAMLRLTMSKKQLSEKIQIHLYW